MVKTFGRPILVLWAQLTLLEQCRPTLNRRGPFLVLLWARIPMTLLYPKRCVVPTVSLMVLFLCLNARTRFRPCCLI